MITTGGRLESGNVAVPTAGSIMNTRNVLYDDMIGVVVTKPFEVPVGFHAVLVGYNFSNAEGSNFRVDGVTLGSHSVAEGGACCSGVENRSMGQTSGPTILFRSPMTLGGSPWVVSESTPRLILAVAGWYACELNDQDHIGAGLQLEYYLVKQALQLPPMYFPGGVDSQGA